MEEKKDEVTVLNTDIEESQKEEDKQNNKEVKQQDNDNKKKTLKTVITTVICTLLFIIILLLLILLGLKKCSNDNNNLSSIEPPSSQEIKEDKEITDRLLFIVKKQMEDMLMEEDTLTNVVAVTYSDNYPDNYNLHITARSDSKLYFYTADNANYSGDKSTYTDLATYLKVDTSTYLGGTINLEREIITLDEINTTIPKSKLVVSKSDTDIKHVSGFYLDNDNKFHIYQRKDLETFDATGSDQIIEVGKTLYTYYQGLNNSI